MADQISTSTVSIQPKSNTGNENIRIIIGVFIAARLILVMSSSLPGLLGYGDFANFVQLAGLKGWPFINYWVEFPPVFPFLNSLVLKLAGGREQSYDYLLFFILTFVDCINLVLFAKINALLHGDKEHTWRTLGFLLVLICFPYTWWYFDDMAVLGVLLGLYWLITQKDALAGLGIALGTLTKLFPVLLLVIPWRYFPKKRAIKITLISLGCVLAVYGGLYLLSPNFTKASLQTLNSKGSWETVWALIDGNYATGNFGSYSQRLNPDSVQNALRHSPVISPLFTLIIFGGFGLWALLKKANSDFTSQVGFVGLTFCVFFIWSQGWSPQWVLYLLPLILLTLPQRESLLYSVLLIFVCLLEWPILYSNRLTNEIWFPIVTRSLILVLLGFTWFQASVLGKPLEKENAAG